MECSICNDWVHDFGHNAQPVNNGRCCDRCNIEYVIVKRIKEQFNKECD